MDEFVVICQEEKEVLLRELQISGVKTDVNVSIPKIEKTARILDEIKRAETSKIPLERFGKILETNNPDSPVKIKEDKMGFSRLVTLVVIRETNGLKPGDQIIVDFHPYFVRDQFEILLKLGDTKFGDMVIGTRYQPIRQSEVSVSVLLDDLEKTGVQH